MLYLVNHYHIIHILNKEGQQHCIAEVDTPIVDVMIRAQLTLPFTDGCDTDMEDSITEAYLKLWQYIVIMV